MTAIRSERMPAPPSETTCFVAGAIAITSFVLLTWRGIALTPDGWAYWQGAVSIAEGRGYRLFSGGAITSWPPLYSLYLSQWTLVMGPTGRGLIVASAVLVGAQAWLWCHVLQNIWYEAEGAIHRPALFAVAIYLGLFVPLTQQYVLANVLEYTILPLLFLAIWRARRAEQASGILGWAAASGVAGSLLLLTHNGGVVFVGTCVLLIAVKGTERRNRVTAALLAGSLPIVVWMTVRHKLGQDGSHSVGFGGGRYAPSTYLQQFVWGLWELVKPSQRTPIIGLGALAVLIAFLVWRRVGRTSLVFGALFAGIAAGGTYVLFNVVWIYDKLDGRFILFIPIILVPLVLMSLAKWSTVAFVGGVVLFLLPQASRTAAWVHVFMQLSLEKRGYPNYFVPPRASLSLHYLQGAPIETETGTILISPDPLHSKRLLDDMKEADWRKHGGSSGER